MIVPAERGLMAAVPTQIALEPAPIDQLMLMAIATGGQRSPPGQCAFSKALSH